MEDADAAPPPPRRAIPWVEKYRPKSMEDVSAQVEVVRSLKAAITSRQIPHLLFYGPPGTGKTSTILAVARDLFGPELMRSRVMELNASDERGIAVVREKVKGFAQSSVGSSSGVAPFKLIILDEADSLTSDAQAALRRTIETYSKVTRFCIICNYVSRIIDPLASRCSKFRFKPLDTASMLARLQHICREEKIDVSDETLHEVLRISAGDLRKAITFLQSASDLYGRRVVPANIVEISGVFPDRLLGDTLRVIKTSGFEGVKRQAQSIMLGGYNILGVLERICEAIISDSEVKPRAKALISERAAAADKRLVDGADEELQLLDVLLLANRAVRDVTCSSDKERQLIV